MATHTDPRLGAKPTEPRIDVDWWDRLWVLGRDPLRLARHAWWAPRWVCRCAGGSAKGWVRALWLTLPTGTSPTQAAQHVCTLAREAGAEWEEADAGALPMLLG